jgi:Zn-dependent protease
MFNKEEGFYFVILSILLGYVLIFPDVTANSWLISAGLALAMLFIHILAQKLAAFRIGCEIEFKPWAIARYGFKKRAYLKRPFPSWLLVPLLAVWLSLGYIRWLAVTVFDVTSLRTKVKGHYAEITEWQIGIIAASGPFANLLLAIVSELVGWHDFAILNAWMAFFTLIPVSELDGTKVLFGGKVFWIFAFVLAVMTLILLGIANLTTTILAAVAVAIFAAVLFYVLYEK